MKQTYTIIHVMRINADGESYVSLHYTGNTFECRSLDLLKTVAREVKLEYGNNSGSYCAGSGARALIINVKGTPDAVLVVVRPNNAAELF